MNQNNQNNPNNQNNQNTQSIQINLNTQKTLSNQKTPNPPYTFLPQHGHYRHLRVYQVTEMIYDITYYFTQHYLQRGFIMKKEIIVIIAICFCNLITSCTSTEYLSRDNCYTCWPIIYSNDEYSEEEFGYKKRVQDSLYAAWKNEHPDIAVPKTLKGNFRVKEIWKEKEFGVVVFFLDDMSDSPLRCKQVLSLMDKPNYKGKSLKVGEVYYFELSPLAPINTPLFQPVELLFENRWLMVEHFCGENIYSSVNLNGDKYIDTSHEK